MSAGKYVGPIVATGACLVGGLWLGASPWVLGFPPGAHGGWSPSTRIDLLTGAGVVAAAGATLAAYAGSAIRAARAAAIERASEQAAPLRLSEWLEEEGQRPRASAAPGPVPRAAGPPPGARTPSAPEPPRATGSELSAAQPPSGLGGRAGGAASADVQTLLAPIAAQLLADLSQRRQGRTDGDAHAGDSAGETRGDVK